MPRTTTPLTDTEIKKAKPRDKDYKLSDGLGLYFLVKQNGTKFWRFDFKYGIKRQSMSFGTYPTVSLKQARDKRAAARKLLSENINPILDKNMEKRSQDLSLNKVIIEWLEFRAETVSNATVLQNRRILKNVVDFLGEVTLKDIKRIDIIDVLRKVQSKGNIETAHRLLSLLNKVYKYVVTKEYIEHNIIADIDKNAVLVPNGENHLPAITEPSEIKELLNDIWVNLEQNYKTDISTLYIFKLVPYVFVRSANIRLMEWDELDFENEVWEIPKKKMKIKKGKLAKSHNFIFPLPKQAISILKEIEPYSRSKGKFVFPSMYKTDRAVVGGTLSDNLNKLGYKGRHCFHGFRSMFSTNANTLEDEHGFGSKIIEACIAHVEKDKVKAAYDRDSKYKYLEEKRSLIQWYADWLDKIIKTG